MKGYNKTRMSFSVTQSHNLELAEQRKKSKLLALLRPSTIIALLYVLFFLLVTLIYHYHALHYVHVGTFFAIYAHGVIPKGALNGAHGFDGQFYYFIAHDPFHAYQLMDNAPYRYQRIVYPLLAMLLSLGQTALIPSVLLFINFVSIVVSTEVVSRLLIRHGLSPWYSLAIGLYFGQTTAIVFDTTEAFTCFLLCIGLLLIDKKRMNWAAILMGLAVLSRETAVLFVGGFILYYFFQKRWTDVFRFSLISVVPTILWYIALAIIFGKTGLTYAPSFQIIPFGGLFTFSHDIPRFSWLLILMFVPIIVGWGILIKEALQRHWGEGTWFIWLINLALVTCMAPASYIELASAGRLSIGMVLAMLLFGWQTRSKWALWGAQIYTLTFFIYTAGILLPSIRFPS